MGWASRARGKAQRVARGGAAFVGLGFLLFDGLVDEAAGVVFVFGPAASRSPDSGLGFGGLGAGSDGDVLGSCLPTWVVPFVSGGGPCCLHAGTLSIPLSRMQSLSLNCLSASA